MTDEEARRMLARMEALAAEVETLRREVADARRTAEDAAAAKEDSADFGGGGEPDWSGAMGRVPDGFIENPAIPPLPDTTAAKDPNALQYKSLDDRKDSPPPGVTQIHDFDETPLSSTRRIELKAVTTTGTGGGRKLQLVDPDGNADYQTKWMVPLREAGTGGREIKWACIGGEVDDACQDSYGLDCAETGGTGTDATLDITLTRTPCGGEPEAVDTCSVPLLTGEFITSLDGFYVQGSNLYLSYTVAEVSRGRKTGTHQAVIACPVTNCEES
jgi:hypothetical protein